MIAAVPVSILLALSTVRGSAISSRTARGEPLSWDAEDIDSTRIVGGTDAALGEFPHQAALLIDGEIFCGGAILSSQWVLTAAHCIYEDGIVGRLKVKAGFVDLSNPDGVEVNVIKIVYHEKYVDYENINDVGLVQVSTLPLNGNVKAINLPSSSSYQYPASAVASGWGVTQEGGSPPKTLQKLVIPFFTPDICYSIYGDEFSDMLMCGGYLEGGKDTCQGDSGGPLVCGTDAGAVLCAIIASGQGCARPNFPGLYTPTAPHLDWIRTNMK